MDFDQLLSFYFGTSDLDQLDEAALDEGRQRAGIAFGVEIDPGRRFALWALLHALGDAPDPAKAFKTPRERKAAEDYARAASRLERD